MSEKDREIWDCKHEQAADSSLGTPLSSTRWISEAPSDGWALDLACGRGRHCGVLLARGYRIVAVDVSRKALECVRQRYATFGGRMVVLQADLDDWPFASEAFDLVLQCDFLDRRLFPAIKASVRAGGCALVDTFAINDHSGSGPRTPKFRLEQGELERAFSDWKSQRVEHRQSPSPRSAILARKPPR